MSSKLSKWLFDIIGGRHERNYREFSVAGFIFTYVQKYFSGPLTGSDRPHRPRGPPLSRQMHRRRQFRSVRKPLVWSGSASFCLSADVRHLQSTAVPDKMSPDICSPDICPRMPDPRGGFTAFYQRDAMLSVGLGWVEIFQFFGGLGWFGSTIAKVLKILNAFKARSAKNVNKLMFG